MLLVTLGGVRADHTSAYLYIRPTTSWPTDGAQRALGRALALDDLADDGVRFARAWAPAESSLSSLKALFTGRSTPFGEILMGLPEHYFTLAERFREASFDTAGFVSGQDLAAATPQGFDVFVHRPTDAEALRSAVGWLLERDFGDGRALFLWIHLDGPTPPWEPGSVPPATGTESGSLDYVRLHVDLEFEAQLETIDCATLFGEGRGRPVDLYDGEVAEMASRLRSFLLAYQTLGQTSALWDDTALVVAGLGGVELGLHRWASSLHSSSVRVPLIFHHPGSVPRARVLAELVELTDVAPTLLDWLGLEPAPAAPGEREGRSLVPLLTGRGARSFPTRPAATVGAGGEQSGSLRDERWTLVWRKPRSGLEQVRLYDRGRDPLELLDVAEHHRDRARRMRNELVRILTRVEP